MSLTAENLACTLDGQRLLNGVSLKVSRGQLHAVIGPNGAGKSTLLKLLAGDLSATQGRVLLNEKPLQQWSARERACLRAVLPQSDALRFSFTAEEVVKLGRLSSGLLSPPQESEIVQQALVAAGAQALAARRYPTLSGGERARVQFARVLAQIWTPTALGDRVLLLDEPTASLDFSHQHACMAATRRFCGQGVAVLAVLHDPNLALRYADQVTLLCEGEVIASGAAEEVLRPENLERVYGVRIEILRSDASGHRHIAVRI